MKSQCKGTKLSLLLFKEELFAAVLLNIFYSGSRILFAYMMMVMTDDLIAGSLEKFVNNLIIASGVVIFQIVTMQLSARAVNKYVNCYMIWIRHNIARGMVRMPIHKIDGEQLESQKALLDTELLYFEDGYIRSRVDVISALIFLVVSCIAIARISVNFFAILVFVVAISLMLPGVFSKPIKKANKKFLGANEEMISAMGELINGNKTIQMNNARSIVDTYYVHKIIKGHKAKELFQNFITFSNSMLILVSLLVTFAIFLAGGFMVAEGMITIGALIAVVQMASNVIQPITDILYSVNEINASTMVKEKIDDIISYFTGLESKQGLGELLIEQNSLSLKDVTYMYSKEKGVKGLSVSFGHNKSYAIVGENGSGKSTLLKLLSGELNGYSGDIEIGGVDIRTMNDEERYSIINYIGQDSFLFDAGWEENITLFGCSGELNEQAVNIIPGFDSIRKNEKSVHDMSGGEQQKVLLLRAINVGRPIVILDEVDSAMDLKAKNSINEILSNMTSSIRIVVTHNIGDDLRMFDEVIYMEDGCIVECGNVDELLNMKGKFFINYGEAFNTSKKAS